MHRHSLALAAVLGICTCVPAAAQLKLPGNAGPSLGSPSGRSAPTPATPAAPASAAPAAKAASAPQAAVAEEKEKAGQLAAAGWLTLLDRRDWGTAWETSATMFRNAVPLPKWMDGAPKVRADFGALLERAPAGVSYKNRLEGLPPGDYVSVVFVSKFEKKNEVEEVVTTVREADGRWRVTGYSTR
jgi:hypothetical protein